MKKELTLEDALFKTGAPEDLILLAMVEAILQDGEKKIEQELYATYNNLTNPFSAIILWHETQQDIDFWLEIDSQYNLHGKKN